MIKPFAFGLPIATSTMTNSPFKMVGNVGELQTTEAGQDSADHSVRAAGRARYSNGAHGVTRPTFPFSTYRDFFVAVLSAALVGLSPSGRAEELVNGRKSLIIENQAARIVVDIGCW